MPHLGAGHFAGMEQMAEAPPDVVYPDRPTTSGIHMNNVAISGVYDKVVDERLLVHNLEHGYVNIFYDQDAPEDQVAQLKAFAREQIDAGRHEKIVVSAWKAELEDDANFAMVAWGVRQQCRDFDEGVVLNFLREHHYLAGEAPERDVRPHLDEGIDPDAEEGDVLFPPLDAEERNATLFAQSLETPQLLFRLRDTNRDLLLGANEEVLQLQLGLAYEQRALEALLVAQDPESLAAVSSTMQEGYVKLRAAVSGVRLRLSLARAYKDPLLKLTADRIDDAMQRIRVARLATEAAAAGSVDQVPAAIENLQAAIAITELIADLI